MKTLLVLAAHPDLADALRGGLDPGQYRLVHRFSVEEAEPILEHGLADACLADVELSTVQSLWIVDKIRRHAPAIPLILFTASHQPEIEETAYLKGATHILIKPIRPRLVATVLERLWSGASAAGQEPAAPILENPLAREYARPALQMTPPEPSRSLDTTLFSASGPIHTLAVLRDFSRILTHSLNTEGMLGQFLSLLREILGVNRAAIFLRQPLDPANAGAGAGDQRRLRAVSSVGLSAALLQHIELSFESGLGAQVARLARIIRRSAEEIRNDVEAQKEFELLGGQVAVPILNRDVLIGVAVFDGRITGEPLLNAELELIFHLLEQLGLAIKNISLHEQVAGSNTMMAEILKELSCACVVVGRDLAVLHANKMARKYFGSRSERRTGEVEFTDLPPAVASKVYQVLKSGAAISNFRFEPEHLPGTTYTVSVVPFQRQRAGLPASALLIAEDLTQSDQLRKLEVEAANLRLVVRMADRLTHEIGNAMVPLSTYHQLFPDKWNDKNFRDSLTGVMADHVKRVKRLVSQMRLLARDSLIQSESFPVGPLIDEAFEEACEQQNLKKPPFKCDPGAKTTSVKGDRAALKQALEEVLLNALQANEKEPKVQVRLKTGGLNGTGKSGVQIEVQDNGQGFSEEALRHAKEPFYTERTVGTGLGLTVTDKVVELHRGKLELVQPKTGEPGVVRITLPVESTGGS